MKETEFKLNEENENDLEIYKNFMESAEKMSEKRMTQNNIYLTVNLAFISYLIAQNVDIKLYILMSFIGILICVIWYMTICNYCKRNKVKYEIINKSQYGKLYDEEWKQLKGTLKLTTYEKVSAIVFVAVYIVSAFLKII